MAETKKNDYVHGSLAEKIQYDPYEDNAILKSKKIARDNKRVKVRIISSIFSCFSNVYCCYAQICTNQ
ncbi:hypothetical protein [Ruminiclostridium josui]|uniref:hypothetical protein n=1 Tax=Ruminiclostridium josui TaxID=1499 RepID=UPI000A5F7470|nr:hypothetical protein [Ruminiclostridium josui]